MNPSLRQLYRLQEIDIKIAESLSALEGVKGMALREEAELKALEASLGELTLKIERIKKGQRLLELELAGHQEERGKIEKKLYGGSTTNPKELSQWQRDLEILQGKIGILEENILEKLIQIEEMEAQTQPLKEKTNKAHLNLDEAKTRQNEEKERMEKIHFELEEKRGRIVANIDEELSDVYENIKDKKGGTAVVKILEEECGGCFMHLPESLIKRVRERELNYCSRCGRILYWEATLPGASVSQQDSEG